MDFQTFLQQFVNALSLGSLYALIAIGYTMVYGILRLINFAHGDVFMVGGYLAFFGVSTFLMPWWLAVIVAIRPLRDSPRISIMISAIGASFLIENLAIVLFDARPKAFPVPAFFARNFVLGGVHVASVSLIIPLVTALILAFLLWMVHRTRVGMAMRAVSTDIEAARLMAIDVNRIVSITFAIGSALAAIGGIMWALKYPRLEPLMGIMPGLKCFIAAVIGGIGSIGGAVLGGLLLGVIELMTVAFLPELTGYKDAFAFVLLIVVLLVKPTGLLGKNQGEKV
jgi:branched-chain amino acid transport system permease protein